MACLSPVILETSALESRQRILSVPLFKVFSTRLFLFILLDFDFVVFFSLSSAAFYPPLELNKLSDCARIRSGSFLFGFVPQHYLLIIHPERESRFTHSTHTHTHEAIDYIASDEGLQKLETKATSENENRPRPLTMMMCLHQIGNLTVQFTTVAYRDAQMNSLEKCAGQRAGCCRSRYQDICLAVHGPLGTHTTRSNWIDYGSLPNFSQASSSSSHHACVG